VLTTVPTYVAPVDAFLEERMLALLGGFFALIAAVLAAVGLRVELFGGASHS